MKNKNGELGIIEIFNDIPPLMIGKHMSKMLDAVCVKACILQINYVDLLDIMNE